MNALHKDDSPLAGGPIAGEQSTDNSVIVGGDDTERKREANARAIAAINGIALHKVTGSDGEPSYIACKWNLSRELSTLGEVENWLDRVTGDAGRRERERRALIDEANRQQDRRDEAADLLRGPGSSGS